MGRREDMQRQQEKRLAAQAEADTRAIMRLREGRRFMYDLLFNRCAIMEVYGRTDSGLYQHEGRRGVGYLLAIEIQKSHPEEYVLMITEHLHDQKGEQALADAARAMPNEET